MIVTVTIAIIVVIVLYAIITYSTPTPNTPVVTDLAHTLADMADNVCRIARYQLPEYGIRIMSDGNSHTSFVSDHRPIINLRVYRDNRPYDDDTVKLAFLHEIAHILTPGHHHDQYFDRVHQRLMDAAVSLYYLLPTSAVHGSYPCQGS